MNWLTFALSLGRLQKKEGDKKAEWQPKRGKKSTCKCCLEQRLGECRWRIKDKAEQIIHERVMLLWCSSTTGIGEILK